jgi:hypothetical protein
MSEAAALALASNQLSLGSNSLGFAKTVADSFVKGSSLVDVSVGILKWLSRECIDGKEFEYALQICNSEITRVFPNESGMRIQDQLRQTSLKDRRIAGLTVTVDGSIGRMFAFDVNYMYLVTTTLSLMADHPPDYAIEALCFMALDKDLHREGVNHPYSIQRTRLKPVMTKIVKSIAYNVANSGHDLGKLPSKLKGLCQHTTSAATFAAVVMAITRNSNNDVLLYSGCFHSDIYLWLCNHYTGHLEVSVEGEILVDVKLGISRPEATARVLLLIRETCKKEDQLHGKNDIEVALSISGKTTPILRASRTVGLMGPAPALRRKFYEVDEINRSYVHESLNAKELTETRLAAQELVAWMLSIPITLRSDLDLGFAPSLDGSNSSSMTIGDLLKNWPKIGLRNWGGSGRPKMCFVPLEAMRMDTAEEMLSLDEIIKHFPAMVSLFDFVKSRCDCTSCARHEPLGHGKIGCLREAALKFIFVLVGDAIAEGFGATDVSGLVDHKLLCKSIHKLLLDLIWDEQVTWDLWFGLAAQVTTGYDWDGFNFIPAEGSTAIVAVQNGSMVVAASWLNLASEINFRACFGFESAEGRLVGVVDECAIVQAERQMEAPSSTHPNPIDIDGQTVLDPAALSMMVKMLNAGDTAAKLETAIIGGGGISYRLLTMVKTKSYRRILDPCRTVMALIRSAFPQCKPDCYLHLGLEEQVTTLEWAFDEAVGCWESGNTFKQNEVQDATWPVWVTYVGAERLALNVVMGLSFHGCVVQDPKLCHFCAVAATSTQGRISAARRILRTAV